MPEMNKVYVLNPYSHLRHDIHRVALFSTGTGAETGCSRNWHTFIHPLQAVMLSFFTYDRPLQETIPLLCDFFYRSREEITGWVSYFINNTTPVHTSTQQGEIYFPKRVLIEAEKAGSALRFEQLDPNSFVWKQLDLTTRRLYDTMAACTFKTSSDSSKIAYITYTVKDDEQRICTSSESIVHKLLNIYIVYL